MPIARRSFLAGLGLIGLFPTLAAAEDSAVQVGSVESIAGVCTARLHGEQRQLAMGSPIYQDDIIITGVGASLCLKLGQSTRLIVGERKRVHIDKYLVDYGGDIELSSPKLLDRSRTVVPGSYQMSTRPA